MAKILTLDQLRELTKNAPVEISHDPYRAKPWRFSINTFNDPDPIFSILSYATEQEAKDAAERQRSMLLNSLAPTCAA